MSVLNSMGKGQLRPMGSKNSEKHRNVWWNLVHLLILILKHDSFSTVLRMITQKNRSLKLNARKKSRRAKFHPVFAGIEGLNLFI